MDRAKLQQTSRVGFESEIRSILGCARIALHTFFGLVCTHGLIVPGMRLAIRGSEGVGGLSVALPSSFGDSSVHEQSLHGLFCCSPSAFTYCTELLSIQWLLLLAIFLRQIFRMRQPDAKRMTQPDS